MKLEASAAMTEGKAPETDPLVKDGEGDTKNDPPLVGFGKLFRFADGALTQL